MAEIQTRPPIIPRPKPRLVVPDPTPIWKDAVLAGDYLYGKRCKVLVNVQGQIIASSVVRCAWSGTERFDEWFRAMYAPRIGQELPE
jgi:hypothetical protein